MDVTEDEAGAGVGATDGTRGAGAEGNEGGHFPIIAKKMKIVWRKMSSFFKGCSFVILFINL